jgi:acyl CoA:acetate/3-ketoacid CoA transferase beta subunit
VARLARVRRRPARAVDEHVVSDLLWPELCIVACAEAWRGDGEILASGIGTIPRIAASLARLTFSPDLLLTDGEALLRADATPADASSPDGAVAEGWMPYRMVFDVMWSGRRHVMMGAAQLDMHGNQNISCIGDWRRPTAQLLGVRGAPGNSVHHPCSYWIPKHTPRVFREHVDMVSGVGTDRAAELPPATRRFHEVRRIVTNLAVLDVGGPGGTVRVCSLHPGVTLAAVQEATGFPLAVAEPLGATAVPSPEQLRLIREVLDPGGLRNREGVAP